MVSVGIGPGLSGAIAVLAIDGTLEALYNTSTLVLRASRGTRQEYDVLAWWPSSRPILAHRRM